MRSQITTDDDSEQNAQDLSDQYSDDDLESNHSSEATISQGNRADSQVMPGDGNEHSGRDLPIQQNDEDCNSDWN